MAKKLSKRTISIIIAEYLSFNTDWSFQRCLDIGNFLETKIKQENQK